ncbi:hypothetical protein ZWY2020_003275 [Hordeum vulgare]|nr:hypothetical protein ZWY2020_003275 [Hordeum vulgare]
MNNIVVHANDDNDDYDIDEQSYAESGTKRNTNGDIEPRTLDDDNDEGDDNDEDDDNDEHDVDASNEDIQESLDRHWEVMAKTFRSEGEAYTFYNKYAKDLGFSIRRDLKRFAKGSSKVLRLRRRKKGSNRLKEWPQAYQPPPYLLLAATGLVGP